MRSQGGEWLRTIYLDVLLVFDLYMNFLLLRLTARLTHTRVRFWRVMAGAFAGSLESLLVLLPALPFWASLLCKLTGSAVMCGITFGIREIKRYLWEWIAFLGASSVIAGGLLALTGTGRIYYANGCWYPVISLRMLVICTIAAYLILTGIAHIRTKTGAADGSFEVRIRYAGAILALEGLADTGNSLVDFCTGRRVIICSRQSLAPMLPERLPCKGFRPLPYRTVAGEGVLLVFHAEEVVLIDKRRGTHKPVDALIGIDETSHTQAIFHPALLH